MWQDLLKFGILGLGLSGVFNRSGLSLCGLIDNRQREA